jgi:hypothetical protein
MLLYIIKYYIATRKAVYIEIMSAHTYFRHMVVLKFVYDGRYCDHYRYCYRYMMFLTATT